MPLVQSIKGGTIMRLKTFVVIGLIVGILFLAGCSSQPQYAPPPSGAPVGGGCGVAPAPVAEDTVEMIGKATMTAEEGAA